MKQNVMYKFLTLTIVAAIFAGCTTSKINDPIPSKSGNDGKNNNINGPYTVKLSIDAQVVNTTVSHDTLYLVYTEKADLLLNKDEYESSWAVHFKEDFSKSNLVNFHFSALNGDNQYMTDYVDDNLNNVKLKTASTVVVDGKTMVKLSLERIFIFSKAYKQAALAVEAQTNILKANKDTISFSAYVYDKKDYDTTTMTTTVSYKKAN